MKIEAAQRLVVTSASVVDAAAGDAWWSSLSSEQQKQYLQLHPRSKYGKGASSNSTTPKQSAPAGGEKAKLEKQRAKIQQQLEKVRTGPGSASMRNQKITELLRERDKLDKQIKNVGKPPKTSAPKSVAKPTIKNAGQSALKDAGVSITKSQPSPDGDGHETHFKFRGEFPDDVAENLKKQGWKYDRSNSDAGTMCFTMPGSSVTVYLSAHGDGNGSLTTEK